MSLIPTVFRSTDPGAPVLSGTAGSFAALMDAVLVDGYGTGADTKAPLGWGRVFSTGNKRAYQNSMVEGGTGMFWRLDDSNAQYVLNSAFHTMAGIDTGVDEFGGGANAWGKSITANSVARQWVIIGNSRTIYIFLQTGHNTVGGAYVGNVVGDYECLNKSYKFNFGLTRTGLSTVTTAAAPTGLLSSVGTYGAFAAARSYGGATVDEYMYTRAALITGSTHLGSSAPALAYPYPPTGGMVVTRVAMNSGGLLFGLLPGLWTPEHSRILNRFQEVKDVLGFTGVGIAVEALSNQACQGLLSLGSEWEY